MDDRGEPLEMAPAQPALHPSREALMSALERTAEVLEVLGEEGFRSGAYRAAARSLEALSEDSQTLLDRHFRGIPKVGPGIAAELMAAVKNGVFAPLAEAESLVPPGVLTLFAVRGLGPKKIRSLWNAGIDSLERLEEAASTGELSALKGFGAKSAATLHEAARFALRSQTRRHLGHAHALGGMLCDLLGHLDARESGELRRRLDTVGTLRVTVTGSAEAVTAALAGTVSDVQAEADKPLVTGRLDGLPVEVGYATPETRGAIDLTFGGGAEYRQATRAHARSLGLDLSGRGLRRGDEVLPTPTERDVLAALGLPYLPPEYREDEHRAVCHSLPPESELIRPEQVLGLLHTHSTWSDGAASVQAMAEAVRSLDGNGGRHYLGTGDHSGAASYAGGLSAERLRQQLHEVRELQRAGLPIIAGSEVDILEDGSLDYPDDLLAELDYVVASVHSHFTLEQERQTERLCKAASHPLVTILGHPTGRLLLRRPGYLFDLDLVLASCAQHGTVVEINANSYRLDLDWRVALNWRERLTFAINTDAHSPAGLDDVRWGVMVARKAGLTPAQVVNTLDREAFLAFVKAQRAARA